VTDEKKMTREDIAVAEREKQLKDLRLVLSKPEGRRLLWRLMGEGRVFHISYPATSSSNDTIFNEGKRSIGLLVLTEVMAANPAAFTQMQNEFASAKKELDARIHNTVTEE
jgi:hypothetical protein